MLRRVAAPNQDLTIPFGNRRRVFRRDRRFGNQATGGAEKDHASVAKALFAFAEEFEQIGMTYLLSAGHQDFPMKQLVIDINTIGRDSTLLLEFFRANNDDQAVITNYFEHELFNANDTSKIRERLRLLSQYKDRIVVLCPLAEMAGLNLKKENARERVIDRERTAQFQKYATRAATNCAGSEVDLLVKSTRSREWMEDLFNSVDEIRTYVEKQPNSYPSNFLREIKVNKSLSPSSDLFLREQVQKHTNYFFTNYSGTRTPQSDLYSIQFRLGLSLALLTIGWHADGIPPKNAKKIRNSITDMTYVACATYFDGVLSEEPLVNDAYDSSKHILHNFYGVG